MRAAVRRLASTGEREIRSARAPPPTARHRRTIEGERLLYGRASVVPRVSDDERSWAAPVQLSGAVVEALETPLPAAMGDYPPTLFVHMPRDEHTARAVERSIDVLRRCVRFLHTLRCRRHGATG